VKQSKQTAITKQNKEHHRVFAVRLLDLFFDPEERGRIFFQNVSKILSDYTFSSRLFNDDYTAMMIR
jgi:hypothetical protein